ncbi:SDR family NAD(P)-dependent oxidoreductase [Pseudomonas sp. YJ42]|uniref:SDR family NAD(P)-dependent oxidoreductase n=1 Tax=Pseudomonas sp. YJ42 TaxID=3392115 RepID=UPI0039A0E73F
MEHVIGVIVITGGSRGIRAGAAEHAARRGIGVILTYYHHPEAAEQVVRGIERAGGRTVALKLDVTNVGSFGTFRDAVFASLQETLGTSALPGYII